MENSYNIGMSNRPSRNIHEKGSKGSTSNMFNIMDDISNFQDQLNPRRQTFEGGIEALQLLLNSSTNSDHSKQKSNRKNRRATVDPSDFESLLNDLSTSEAYSPTFSQSSNYSLGSMKNTKSSSTKTKPSQNTSTRRSPRLKRQSTGTENSESGVFSDIGSPFNLLPVSTRPNARRETADPADLADIMFNLDDSINQPLNDSSNSSSINKIIPTIATQNNKSHRQTFEGGTAGLQNLLNNSNDSYNSFSLEQPKIGNTNTNTRNNNSSHNDRRNTADPADLMSLLNDLSRSDDGTTGTSNLVVNQSQNLNQSVNSSPSISISSSNSYIPLNPKGTNNQIVSKRRETVDANDLANIMNDLEDSVVNSEKSLSFEIPQQHIASPVEEDGGEGLFVSPVGPNTKGGKNKVYDRRQTVDANDMQAMLNDLESEEHELSQIHAAAVGAGAGGGYQTKSHQVHYPQTSSISIAAMLLPGTRGGRESVDTITLMESVANILNDLVEEEGEQEADQGEDSLLQSVRSYDEESCVSSISTASSVKKFHVYNQPPYRHDAIPSPEEHQRGTNHFQKSAPSKVVPYSSSALSPALSSTLSSSAETVNTFALMQSIKATIDEANTSGNSFDYDNNDNDDDDCRSTLSSVGSICGLLNRIENDDTEQFINDFSSPVKALLLPTAMDISPLYLPTASNIAAPPSISCAQELKSCMSSKKYPRQRYDEPFSSIKKTVVFGSPSFAEFNKTSPTTNITPMDKKKFRGCIDMDMSLSAYSDEQRQEQVMVDEETVENSQILDAWDRLTNMSGSDGSDDEIEQLNNSTSKSTKQNKKSTNNENSKRKKSMSPASTLNSNSSKRAKRRKSMMLKPLPPPADIESIDNSYSYGLDKSNMSEMSEGATRTMPLPSSLTDLLARAETETDGILMTAYCTATDANTYQPSSPSPNEVSSSFMSNDECTHELELDLQSLMRRVSYGNRSVILDIPQDIEEECSLASSNKSKTSEDCSNNLSKDSCTSLSSARSLNTILGQTNISTPSQSDIDCNSRRSSCNNSDIFQAFPHDEANENENNNNFSCEGIDSYISVGSCGEGRTVPLEGAMAELFANFNEYKQKPHVAIDEDKSTNQYQYTGSGNKETSAGNEEEDDDDDCTENLEPNLLGLMNKVSYNFNQPPIYNSSVMEVSHAAIPEEEEEEEEDKIVYPNKVVEPVMSSVSMLESDISQQSSCSYSRELEGVSTYTDTAIISYTRENDMLAKLQALNANARRKSLAHCSTPGASLAKSQVSNQLQRQSLLLKQQQSTSTKADLHMPSPFTSTAIPVLTAAVVSKPVIEPTVIVPVVSAPLELVIQSVPIDVLLSRCGISNSTPSIHAATVGYAHKDISIERCIQQVLSSATSNNAAMNIFADILKAAIIEVNDQIKNFSSSISIWDKTAPSIQRKIIDCNSNLQRLGQESIVLADYNWLAWESRLMGLAKTVIDKYTHSLAATTKELAESNLTKQSMVDAKRKEESEGNASFSQLQAQRNSQLQDIENLRKEIAMAKGGLESLEVETANILEQRKNSVVSTVANILECKREAVHNAAMAAMATNRLLFKTSSSLSLTSEQDSTIELAEENLLELKSSVNVINRLTYCRILKYSTEQIVVETILSTQLRMTMIFNLSAGTDEDEHKFHISNLAIDLDIRNNGSSSSVASSRDTVLANSYFANVLGADDISGPVSPVMLNDIKYPHQIPSLLTKLSGYVAILRLLACNLESEYGDAWGVDGGDILISHPSNPTPFRKSLRACLTAYTNKIS